MIKKYKTQLVFIALVLTTITLVACGYYDFWMPHAIILSALMLWAFLFIFYAVAFNITSLNDNDRNDD